MATRRGAPGKNEIELRKIEVGAEQLHRRYDLAALVARGVITVGCVLALALPVREFVRPIAGHTTVFTANVVLSVTLGLSGLVHVLRESKNYSRRRELQRLRKRIQDLERRLGLPATEQRPTPKGGELD
jgi:cobalamin biosynthesis protein CobD/CbiB